LPEAIRIPAALLGQCVLAGGVGKLLLRRGRRLLLLRSPGFV
jgi:hypothetical protein